MMVPGVTAEAQLMGRKVTVTVDRPMGSCHPEYPSLYYPINYGYVQGVIAADGEAQDAYILGVSQPVSQFTGRVIALIRRYDDIEDKLVVAPDGVSFTKEAILEQTHFQEQYFQITVEMAENL